ncbi:hypothetical protein ACFLR4_01310 [Bacteroidota bacterium]
MKRIPYLIIPIMICACSVQTGNYTTRPNPDQKFTETSLEGYWRNINDGLEVHITQLGFSKPGGGSFKDINGVLTHNGKLQNIRYIGGNKWSCEIFLHRSVMKYPDNPGGIIWRDAVIELININYMIAGNEEYYRI